LARPGRWQRNVLRVRSIGRALIASVAGAPREIDGLDPAAWVLPREVRERGRNLGLLMLCCYWQHLGT